jgi:hypothetical protein
MLGYQDKGCWDPNTKQVRFFSHKHLSDNALYEYNEGSNRWRDVFKLPEDTPFTFPHGYQHNTIDPATGDLFYMMKGGDPIRRWDRATDDFATTTISNPSPNGGSTLAGAIEWLPSIGAQGGLIFICDNVVKRWTKTGIDTGTWATVQQDGGLDQSNHSIAQRSVPGNFVYVGGGNNNSNIYKVGPTGGLTALAQQTSDPIGIYGSCSVADPVTGDLITVRANGAGSYFDDSDGVWRNMTGDRAPPNFGADIKDVVAIPISTHNAIMFVDGQAHRAWLYKHA